MTRVGIDAQSVAEVRQALEEFGDRYRRRLFTAAEIDACGGAGALPARAAEGLAARFAAKEATLKVLRVTETVPAWTEIEVVRESGGWTSLRLTGVAARLARESGLTRFEVSLTHTPDVAMAVVAADS